MTSPSSSGAGEPPASHHPPHVTDRAWAIDAAAVLAVGVAICAASHRPAVMSVVVPVVLVLRFLAWSRLPVAVRGLSVSRELVFFALCMALGAGNDWNSVVRHHVYDYTVPLLVPRPRAIPVWMLLYWGMVLRFIATLCRWKRLAPPPRPADDSHLGKRLITSPGLKIAGELGLTVATRQMIYAYYMDPLLSWLPFAAGLVFYPVVWRLSRHERVLLVLAAIGGPLFEIVLIQVGGLHVYHLGWFGGVPLWIILWWMLAVLVWNDLSARVLAWLAGERPVDRP
jgi:hypothetical protein